MDISAFKNKKIQAIGKLNDAIASNKVDMEVIDLINLINSFDEYYTTSSCAGRIVILSKDSFRGKYSAKFIFKKHGFCKLSELNFALKNIKEFILLYFNVEPPTFHIAAKTFEDAIKIHKLALDVGLGYSMFKTIKKSIIVEVRGTGLLQIPIGEKNNFLIEQSYFQFLLNQGNEILSDEQNLMKLFTTRLAKFNDNS